MLRLRQGRRRHQLCDGAGQPLLPGGGGGAGQAVRHGGARLGLRPRRQGAAGEAAHHQQAGRPGLPPLALLPRGGSGAGLSAKAGTNERDPHPVWSGLCPQPLGRPHPGTGQRGIRQAGPAGRRAGGEQQGRPDLRPLPQPGDVPHHRRPRKRHRLRRPGDGRLHPQIPQLPGHPGVQQKPQRLCPEHGQKVQGGAGHPHRGVYGHHLPAPGGV